MKRRIAVVGDKLEHGGHILPYSGRVFTIGDAGHRVALIGGTAWCAVCKSTGVIAKAGGPRRMNFIGETAADRDIVLCKCPVPQKIFAALAGNSWCDDMAETLGVVTPIPEYSGRAMASAEESTKAASTRYDDRFVLRDASGQPLLQTAYAIRRKTGIVEYGETDASGHTHLLASVVSAENIDIYVGE